MLKKRLIGVLVLKDNWVVQSIGFSRYLPIGSLEVSVEYLNQWGIDEIIVLDIDTTRKSKKINYSLIEKASEYSQSPLTVGGGIKTVENMIGIIKSGADKVVINSAFLENPTIVSQGAKYFGNQCMVVSIDVVKSGHDYAVFNRNIDCSEINLFDIVKLAEAEGAGEIFINAVDRDGMKNGYDLDLYEQIKSLVDIPIIFCGGIGSISHIISGADAGINALAVGNFFHFTEMSVILTKELMSRAGIDIRQDTYSSYEQHEYDEKNLRLLRLNEKILEDMKFEKVEEEKV